MGSGSVSCSCVGKNILTRNDPMGFRVSGLGSRAEGLGVRV